MYRHPLYKWYVLFVLTLVYTTNIADRFVLSTLIEPIREEFGVSDSALGFLSGFAFAILYTILGVPIAYFADRMNRRNIVAVAVGVYSIMTAMCGAAQSFAYLVLARIGVGVGEAGGSPPSHALVSDLFPRSERAFALAVLGLGASIGLILGFSGGAWIAGHWGWRSAFYAMAIPGLIVAILVRFTVSEPARPKATANADSLNVPGLMESFRFLWSQKTYLHVVLGGSLLNAYVLGMSIFLPAVLVRSHGFTVGEAGQVLGWTLGLTGSVALVLGGYFTDVLGKKDFRWHPWLTAGVTLITLPGSLGVLVFGEGVPFYVCIILFGIVNSLFLGPLYAMAQNLVEPRMRALAAALLMFSINVIGMGLGPQLVGIFSDLLNLYTDTGEDSLRYALIISILITGPWSVLHYHRAARTIRGEYSRVIGRNP